MDAKLKGYDEQTGLCVVSVKMDDLSDSTINEIDDANLSKNINVGRGTSVIAVGAPAGINNSVVAGFVTSIKNEISISDRNLKYFTTDILAENAGFCLLVNTNGDVLGIATERVLDSDGYLSVVYASQLYELIDTIKEGKSVPYIGLKLTSVTESMSELYDLPEGVYVKNVDDDSPAFEAGIQTGDVITSINNVAISDADAYTVFLESCEPKQNITVTLMRMGADRSYSQIDIPVVTE